MGRVSGRRRVVRVRDGGTSVSPRQDTLAVEEPLEIRVGGCAYTTTMRTPGHDVELVHGLLAAEGIIARADDVVTARYCAGSVVTDESGVAANTYNVLDVELAAGLEVPASRRRTGLTTSACGVCGTASIELVTALVGGTGSAGVAGSGGDGTRVEVGTLLGMPDTLRARQRLFDATGGVHAAGLFTTSGECLVVREDVGRHNAVDKVLGWALLEGRRPGRGLVLFVSGRTSYELAAKAVTAGVPVLAGVSAPSSLAVDVAQAHGLALLGFVRGAGCTVYAGEQRIAMP